MEYREALQKVQHRIQAFHSTGEPEWILHPDSIVEANALIRMAPGPEGQARGDPRTIEVLTAIAHLHWCRYMALPAGRDQVDLQRALTYFETLYGIAPEVLPADLRNMYDEASPQPDDHVGDNVAQARTALASTPAGHPDYGTR